MRYTQSQIRELLSISVDAFRTWRDAIPALASHKGHAPSFTPGDVVAIAIVAELVRDFGVRVGAVGSRFDQLIRECHGKSWLALESYVVQIEADGVRLCDIETSARPSPDASAICIPCGPIVSRLQSALTATETDLAQGYLKFPPTGIRPHTERRERQA